MPISMAEVIDELKETRCQVLRSIALLTYSAKTSLGGSTVSLFLPFACVSGETVAMVSGMIMLNLLASNVFLNSSNFKYANYILSSIFLNRN